MIVFAWPQGQDNQFYCVRCLGGQALASALFASYSIKIDNEIGFSEDHFTKSLLLCGEYLFPHLYSCF